MPSVNPFIVVWVIYRNPLHVAERIMIPESTEVARRLKNNRDVKKFSRRCR